jgi:hypothetical protein
MGEPAPAPVVNGTRPADGALATDPVAPLP